MALISSCSDDNDVKTPLSSTQIENGGATYNSLSFHWEPVAGATQYGYELSDPNGKLIVRDVTDVCEATFNELQPSTEYTLTVWAYAGIFGDHATSAPIVLKATTDGLSKVATPEPEYNANGSASVISWGEVPNATSYSYILSSGEEIISSGEVETTSVTFNNLEKGDYKFEISANSTEPGFTDGDSGILNFSVTTVEIWRVSGTYTSAITNKSWQATLVAYDNDSYSLLAWYGVEGYDFNFSYDKNDTEDPFKISGYEYDEGSYTYGVPSGVSSLGEIWVYPWDGYCNMDGDRNSEI